MLVKLLIVAGLIYLVGRNFLKLVGGNQASPKKKTNLKNKDDAIDADYTVVDDK